MSIVFQDLYQSINAPQALIIDRVAEEIIRRYVDKLPDLSALIVLLPTPYVAANLKNALHRAAARSTLLLPRIFTLASFAKTALCERRITPSSLRLVQLYAALKARNWFDASSLWRIATELSQLFDELTLSQRDLPSSVEDFIVFLEKSYQAKADTAMRFEARLVHEMWYAFNRAEAVDKNSPLTAAAIYCLQLSFLVQNANSPLCVVDTNSLLPVEKAFVNEYARRQPVFTIITENVIPDSLTQCLSTAWESDADLSGQLRQRAKLFAQGVPKSPLSKRVKLYGATHLEDEAQVAVEQIQKWLVEGKQNIAVVAADRLVARRTRALLERNEILISDESGWTMSTTSASTIIMRLLETVGEGFYYRDVLDLIKSPFFLTDWLPERRKKAVYEFEKIIREQNIITGLNRYQTLTGSLEVSKDVKEIVARLTHAGKRFKAGIFTLPDWLQHLFASLTDLGSISGLTNDIAGKQLFKLLNQLREELSSDTERINFQEWRRWLNAELEAAVFYDNAVVSPIVMTSLAATRLRRFDAVVIVGADDAHLNTLSNQRYLFNQAVRQDLSLPGVAAISLELKRNLIGLITHSDEILMTWQASKNGEHNAISPWLARLEAFHTIAYGESLLFKPIFARQFEPIRFDLECINPSPCITEELVPKKISASGYNSLIACPYQFFARHILALNTQDDVAEEMEKRDYGERVHEILARFHEEYPSISNMPEDEAEKALRQITDLIFEPYIQNDYASLAWKFRWEKRISAYLAWHRQWESEGWLFNAAEKKFEQSFTIGKDRAVILHGRLDRIDRHKDDGRLAVLDYKTQKRKLLVDKLIQPGEDVQLPVYVLLLGEDSDSTAAYVSLDDKKVSAVTVDESLPILSKKTGERLQELFDGMQNGQPLPANGAVNVCQYCEMRGLCRLDYWQS